MSYTNQMDYQLLDRQFIRDILMQLAGSPVATDRAQHLQALKALCESDLERQWLDFLEKRNLRLPDAGQELVESCSTRPDFLYREQMVAVYIDGPQHDLPDVAAHDREVESRLEDQGYTVIRFGYKDDWPSIAERYGYILGRSE